jgi:hypothetical protein
MNLPIKAPPSRVRQPGDRSFVHKKSRGRLVCATAFKSFFDFLSRF